MLKQLLFTFMLTASTGVMAADKKPAWLDPAVNQVNMEPRHASFFGYENAEKANAANKYQSSR